jgi:uncharacterized protein YbjQ (UPF0145 family)
MAMKLSQVVGEGLARSSGIMQDDILISLDNNDIASDSDFSRTRESGEKPQLAVIFRGGTLLEVLLPTGKLGITLARFSLDAEPEYQSFLKDKRIAAASAIKSIIVVTSDHIPTMKVVSTLGLARGSTVRAKHMGRDIGASLKNIVGGEIVGYTEMMAEAREEALYRMKEDAVRLGANGVTAFRFASATIDVGSAEVTAYGTAVTVEKGGV